MDVCEGCFKGWVPLFRIKANIGGCIGEAPMNFACLHTVLSGPDVARLRSVGFSNGDNNIHVRRIARRKFIPAF